MKTKHSYSQLLSMPAATDYDLLDSGAGEKLERYGKFVVRRPDPQALWPQNLTERDWQKADANFSAQGKWQLKKALPDRWPVEIDRWKFWIKLSAFKHTGVFPEQAANWQWIYKQIKDSKKKDISVLNLFAYTGGATLAAASAGARVCHVDASKVALNWAKDNAQLSHLSEKPIRWLLDDAVAFVKRELRRGNKYDAIIMDPPAFGHGPTGELWKIERDFVPFVADCAKLLTDKPLFVLVNGYASGYSALAYHQSVQTVLSDKFATIESGELLIPEKGGERFLPCGIFARAF
ncbi:MAG TPA: class I SAM-dependent methyltransferase [bacterium]|nr:class I SAM-dependent methyltransferase [bacterium]